VATVAKFYLLDAVTPNTGTMPSTSPAAIAGTVIGDAPGASTARDATDVAGTTQQVSTVTSVADVLANRFYGHRRFVSRPLAAHTFAAADGNWTFSFAWAESNTSHSSGTGGEALDCYVYAWTPSTGLRNGTSLQWARCLTTVSSGATTQTAYSSTATWTTSLTISDGDVLVFDVFCNFQQGMSTSYTETFAYNGTTEASTTTCASFVTPPAALTLFTAATGIPDVTTARART
jgi:hypothetical protein